MPSTAVTGIAQYEMFVSHSPPVFSHSPPSYSDYGPNLSRYFDPSRSLCRTQSLTPIQCRQRFQKIASQMPTKPKRPCLVVKNIQPTEQQTAFTDDQKAKKRVVFADDKGRSLTEIRVMSEPSNVPPLWSIEFLSHVTQGFITPDVHEVWTVTFKQPASDYLKFRGKLDSHNVSLENVIVKENESIVIGTVKVKNMSYQKQVIVRSTWDNWKTQQDTICSFTPISGTIGGSSYVLYDTFSFKLTLPPSSNTLEFCVCYRCNNTEYWDNNDSLNYKLSKKQSTYNGQSAGILMDNKINGTINDKYPAIISDAIDKYNELTQSKMTSYSEFASWNHLDHVGPYW